jgi:predicted unusual protein kinase regulating ubiquinone biosynthesis (AarF/ABC1/UbiB family)
MKVLERVRSTNRLRVQELVQDIFDTFYTWPLMLPQELVYFFRAVVLLEGIGFRYDPGFDGLQFIRGVIRQNRVEIARAMGKEPVQVARGFVDEAQAVLRSVRDLIARAEREELRVRIHPRDIQTQERFLHLQARRLLLSIFATATAVITAILYISVPSWWLLAAGLFASLVMFVLVFLIPTHLLENPLRRARGVRPGLRRR